MLTGLVKSIRRFYPHIPVLVVDDSAAPLERVPAGVTRYLHEPHNSLGIAGGRNFGLGHVESEYVLICDDDMVFVPRTDLGKMLQTLETTPFDIVACRWLDHDPRRDIPLGHRRFEGTAEIVRGDVVRRLGVASGEVDGLPAYDVVANFFVASVDRLGPNPWNARLNDGLRTWKRGRRSVASNARCSSVASTRAETVSATTIPHSPATLSAIWAGGLDP